MHEILSKVAAAHSDPFFSGAVISSGGMARCSSVADTVKAIVHSGAREYDKLTHLECLWRGMRETRPSIGNVLAVVQGVSCLKVDWHDSRHARRLAADVIARGLGNRILALNPDGTRTILRCIGKLRIKDAHILALVFQTCRERMDLFSLRGLSEMARAMERIGYRDLPLRENLAREVERCGRLLLAENARRTECLPDPQDLSVLTWALGRLGEREPGCFRVINELMKAQFDLEDGQGSSPLWKRFSTSNLACMAWGAAVADKKQMVEHILRRLQKYEISAFSETDLTQIWQAAAASGIKD